MRCKNSSHNNENGITTLNVCPDCGQSVISGMEHNIGEEKIDIVTIDKKESSIFQIEIKEDLQNFSFEEIYHSLVLLHGIDIENAIYMTWFINKSDKPDISYLKSTIDLKKELDRYLEIPDFILEDLYKLYKSNQLTNFKNNFKYL